MRSFLSVQTHHFPGRRLLILVLVLIGLCGICAAVLVGLLGRFGFGAVGFFETFLFGFLGIVGFVFAGFRSLGAANKGFGFFDHREDSAGGEKVVGGF